MAKVYNKKKHLNNEKIDKILNLLRFESSYK